MPIPDATSPARMAWTIERLRMAASGGVQLGADPIESPRWTAWAGCTRSARSDTLRQSLQSNCTSSTNREEDGLMRVREGMSSTVLTIGPGHTLREAARLMSQRRVGAAVVLDPDA